MAPTQEKSVGPTKDGTVNVKLAHPLNPKDLIALGVDPDAPSNVNDIIEVSRDNAVSLIGSGFVQVDPSDAAAVLTIVDGAKAAEGVEPSATSGNNIVVDYKALKGDALDDALGKRGLPIEGTADEKRAALATHDAQA